MIPTQRLFDEDSHLFDFAATVLSVERGDRETVTVILDKTAFFPEGGGQYADRGTLAGCPVLDVQEEEGGIILHRLDAACSEAAALSVGMTVEGHLDVATRLSRMQNHTAEHILSGIIHRRFGYNNVGFHLGDGDVTLDLDGVLSRAQLDAVEDEANAVIRMCLPVRAYYPDPAALSAMTYRSKLDLSENVRMVEIGEGDALADRCACCAPHVANTGEIGCVKMLDFQHYKGGIRIHMLAGAWALADHRRRYAATAVMAAAMSVKQDEVTEGFGRLCADLEEKRHTIATLRGKIQTLTVAAVSETDGSICFFDEGLEAVEMRRLLNQLKTKCKGLCGIFSGGDTEGYRFVIGRGDDSLDLKIYISEIRESLLATGGGSSEMVQGSARAARETIEAYFRAFSPTTQQETGACAHRKGDTPC